MKRYALNELYKWKANKDRKPLIMLGARQVGKTWLMQEFAKESYKKHWTVMILQDVRTAVDAACLGLEIPLKCMKII